MSAQVYDKIRYQNTEYPLAATPLEDYFNSHPELRPTFKGFDTGCMRGYITEWTVRDDRLYLTDIKMVLSTDATFASLFPDAGPDGIFADWVSGELKCPYGAIVKPVHAAFGTVWEKEMLLTFHNGVLTGMEERRNA